MPVWVSVGWLFLVCSGSLFLAWEWRAGPTWCWVDARRDLYVRKMLRTEWVPNLNINTKRKGIPEPISTGSEWKSRNWFNTLPLNLHWTDRSTVGGFVATISRILWWWFSHVVAWATPSSVAGVPFYSLCVTRENYWRRASLKQHFRKQVELSSFGITAGSWSLLTLCAVHNYNTLKWFNRNLPLYTVPIEPLSCDCFSELGYQQ